VKISNITAVIDTREQNPLSLEYKKGEKLATVNGTLYTGDYSLRGLEDYVAIERKSLDDMMGCIGKGRERFERELLRLRGYEVKAIVVEATWEQIEKGEYRSRVNPSAAIGTLMGWIAQGFPIVMTGDHKRAGAFVARMLYITARRRYAQLKSLEG
jgi:DNA excision repair protein ERCC-4